MGPENLDELLARARRRDPDALAEVVDRYGPRVFGLLYRLVRSRDAAEDLMQDTFLRVVRMIGQYQHDGKFEAWLFRIAANLARDYRRRHQRRGVMASLDGSRESDTVRDAAPIPGPEARVMRDESSQRLLAGLERLPDADREILLLRHYSDLSFREIAALLEVPVGTALARAHRALQKLRVVMGADVEDEAV